MTKPTLTSPTSDPALCGEPRWKGGRWVWAAYSVLAAAAALVMAVLSGDLTVFIEGGLCESQQAGLLLLAVLSAIVMASRLLDARCRSTTLLLGVLATLALARELDMHKLINPEQIGAWGIRYRIDWWMDPSVRTDVKAVWLGAMALLAGVIGLLSYRSAGPIDWRLARPRLMLLTGAMYFAGFVCDDLLRGVIALPIAQGLEETAELLAAGSLLGATLAPESAGSGLPVATGVCKG